MVSGGILGSRLLSPGLWGPVEALLGSVEALLLLVEIPLAGYQKQASKGYKQDEGGEDHAIFPIQRKGKPTIQS